MKNNSFELVDVKLNLMALYTLMVYNNIKYKNNIV